MSKIKYLFATGFGVGYLPYMPGTFGSILGVVLFLAILSISIQFKILIFVLLFFSGVITSAKIEAESGVTDNQIIVIDEIAGMWITLLLAPSGLWWIVASLIVFRIIDIAKPYPIRKLESLKNGFGVMLDDILAGIYSGTVLVAVERYIL